MGKDLRTSFYDGRLKQVGVIREGGFECPLEQLFLAKPIGI